MGKGKRRRTGQKSPRGGQRSEVAGHTAPPASPTILAAAVVGSLLAYLLLFYGAPLPSLGLDEHGAAEWYRLDIVLLPLGDGAVSELADQWFGDALLAGIAERVPILFAALVIVGLSGAVGYFLLELVRGAEGLTRGETILFSLAVGLNAASLVTLLVGLAGGLTTPLPFAVVVAAAVAATSRLKAHRRRRQQPESQRVTPPTPETFPAADEDWLDRRMAWLVAPLLVVIVLGGTLPPVEFDVREYHLQAPKEFFQQGQVTFLPHNVYANMALGSEMLSLLSMVVVDDWWRGALVGKTIISLFAILGAWGLWLAGRRFISPTAGLVAAIVYVSIPWIVRVSNLGLVEGASAFYLLMTGYAVVLAVTGRAEQLRSRLLVAGFLAGAAVSTKYPAALFVALPATVAVAACAWWAPAVDSHVVRWRRATGWVALFVVGVVVGCGPWFAKNAVLAGNPVYPLLYETFDGATRTADKDAQWRRAHRPANFSAADLMGRLKSIAGASEWHSAALVPLACLAFARRRDRWAVVGLWAAFLFVIATWWLFTHRIDRFWVPALPILAMLAGIGATWCAATWWRWTLLGFLTVTTLLNLVFATTGPGGYNRYLAPLDTLRTSAERVPVWIQDFRELDLETSGVLAVGDAQVFDFEVPVLYNTVFDDCIFEQIVRDKSPEEVRQALAGRAAHVYVHWGEIARYRSAGNYGFSDFVTPEVFRQLVEDGVLSANAKRYGEGRVEVYRVLP